MASQERDSYLHQTHFPVKNYNSKSRKTQPSWKHATSNDDSESFWKMHNCIDCARKKKTPWTARQVKKTILLEAAVPYGEQQGAARVSFVLVLGYHQWTIIPRVFFTAAVCVQGDYALTSHHALAHRTRCFVHVEPLKLDKRKSIEG